MNKICFVLLFLFLYFPCRSQTQTRELTFYLQAAEQNSPLLSDYQNQIGSLGLDSTKLRAAYGPQVNMNGNLVYAPIVHGWGYDQAITNGQNITAQMEARKEIVGKNNLQTRLNDFTLQKKGIANRTRLSKKELEQNVVQQYLQCYGDQQQLDLFKEIFSVLEKEDVVLKRLAQTAVVKQTDYLNFKVALQQQALTNEQIKTKLLGDLSSLNYICGIEDSSLTKVSNPDFHLNTIESFGQSVYAESFETDSLKNVNDSRIIRLDYQPKLNVFANSGYQSSLPAAAYKNFGLSVGIDFSLPVYDGHQKKLALLQNELAQNSREKYRDFAQKQYNQQVLQLLQQINQYQRMEATASLQIKYAKTLVEANKAQLSTGDVRMTDYLLSVTNYLNLRMTLIDNEMTRFALINQLNYLILK